MKRKWIILYGVLTIIIVMANTPPFPIFIDAVIKQDLYAYSNGDGTSTNWCGGSFKDKPYPNIRVLSTTIIDSTIDWDSTSPRIPIGAELRQTYPNADTIIYRLFSKNPLRFWHWRGYLFEDEKYSFPYKSWDEINKKRGDNFKLNGRWQVF